MPQTSMPGLINWLRIALVAVIWGGAFMVVSVALRDFAPLTLAAARIFIGAVALWGIMRLRGSVIPPLRDLRVWAYITAVGVLSSALPFALLSWGQQHVPSAFAGMTMAALPLFVLPLAHILVPGETMTWRKTLGFAVGFVGTVLLIGTSGLGASEGPVETLGRIACVTAALSYALGSIATKLCPPVDQLAFSTLSLVIASAIKVPLAILIDGMPAMPSSTGWLAIVYLGVVPTAVAFIIKVAVIRSAGPSFMTLTNYQVPVWSVIFGAWLLNEALPPQVFAALALILLGVALSQLRTLRSVFRH